MGASVDGLCAKTEDEDGGEVERVMGLTMSEEEVDEGYITAVDTELEPGAGGEGCGSEGGGGT